MNALLGLQQGDCAVGSVSEGVVDGRVDARLIQGEFEAGPVTGSDRPRLQSEELVARVGIEQTRSKIAPTTWNVL